MGSAFSSTHLLDHSALAALDESRHNGRVFALKLANLLYRLRRVQLGRQQQPKGFLQSLKPLRRKPAPRQADLINPERLVLAPRRGQRERQHVLRNNRSPANKGVL